MLFPISYFGSIAYFSEFVKWPEIEIEAKEHFPKQTFRNRCNILGANGIIPLSIPVSKPDGSKTAMDRILIVEDGWRDIHWRSIRSAYESAPFFDYYGPEIKELIYSSKENLMDLNVAILERIISWLDLPNQITLTTEFNPYTENDLRLALADKNTYNEFKKAPYHQVFPGDNSYREDISILDAILCEGPMARLLLLPKDQ